METNKDNMIRTFIFMKLFLKTTNEIIITSINIVCQNSLESIHHQQFRGLISYFKPQPLIDENQVDYPSPDSEFESHDSRNFQPLLLTTTTCGRHIRTSSHFSILKIKSQNYASNWCITNKFANCIV